MEKYQFVIKKGMNVLFDFENSKETILQLKQDIKKNKKYLVIAVLPNNQIVLSGFGIWSFPLKLLVAACKTKGCNNPMFCTNGLCERCYMVSKDRRAKRRLKRRLKRRK